MWPQTQPKPLRHKPPTGSCHSLAATTRTSTSPLLAITLGAPWVFGEGFGFSSLGRSLVLLWAWVSLVTSDPEFPLASSLRAPGPYLPTCIPGLLCLVGCVWHVLQVWLCLWAYCVLGVLKTCASHYRRLPSTGAPKANLKRANWVASVVPIYPREGGHLSVPGVSPVPSPPAAVSFVAFVVGASALVALVAGDRVR